MLSFLLDEQISPRVAAQATQARPEVAVTSLREWRDGRLMGQSDAELLAAAAEEAQTLVTYDMKTIPPLLTEWAAEGRAHAGIVFVDTRTLAPGDFGGLVRALHACWDTRRDWDWTDRVIYLQSAG